MKKLIIIICLIGVILFAYTSFSEAKTKKLIREVDITVSDNLVINATLFLTPNSNVKSKAPLAIFLPPIGGNKTTYNNLAKKLSENGIAVIAINPRGHSHSCTKTNGKKIFWQSMSKAQFAKYPTDLSDILEYIKKNYLAIDGDKYVIVGADLTANAAIIYASAAKIPPKELILFSPYISYKGLETAIPLVKYGQHPVLVFVSKADTSGYKNALELKKYAQGDYRMEVFPSGGTGDNLLKIYNTSIESEIYNSIQNVLK